MDTERIDELSARKLVSFADILPAYVGTPSYESRLYMVQAYALEIAMAREMIRRSALAKASGTSTSPAEIKVWVHIEDLVDGLARGWPASVFPKQDGFKSRVRATITLLLPTPNKGR